MLQDNSLGTIAFTSCRVSFFEVWRQLASFRLIKPSYRTCQDARGACPLPSPQAMPLPQAYGEASSSNAGASAAYAHMICEKIFDARAEQSHK
eukprot:14153-Heterococcus_DN1.PRE.5